jgi:hypothetical protein
MIQEDERIESNYLLILVKVAIFAKNSAISQENVDKNEVSYCFILDYNDRSRDDRKKRSRSRSRHEKKRRSRSRSHKSKKCIIKGISN